MAENAIVIIGGVRYRAEDALRLGISAKTPKPPATAAAAEVAAAAGESTIVSTEAVKGADDAGTVPSESAGSGDANEVVASKPRAGTRSQKG